MAKLESALLGIWSEELRTDMLRGTREEGGPKVSPLRVKDTDEEEKMFPDAMNSVREDADENFAMIDKGCRGIPIEKESAA